MQDCSWGYDRVCAHIAARSAAVSQVSTIVSRGMPVEKVAVVTCVMRLVAFWSLSMSPDTIKNAVKDIDLSRMTNHCKR